MQALYATKTVLTENKFLQYVFVSWTVLGMLQEITAQEKKWQEIMEPYDRRKGGLLLGVCIGKHQECMSGLPSQSALFKQMLQLQPHTERFRDSFSLITELSPDNLLLLLQSIVLCISVFYVRK